LAKLCHEPALSLTWQNFLSPEAARYLFLHVNTAPVSHYSNFPTFSMLYSTLIRFSAKEMFVTHKLFSVAVLSFFLAASPIDAIVAQGQNASCYSIFII
jgi:hypothetical protein